MPTPRRSFPSVATLPTALASPGVATEGSQRGSALPPALNLRTYKRAVYETFRDMITWFELLPGDRLVESELAAQLGVSKTPVREALAMLEADGLAEAAPYRGATVRWLSVNEMREQGFLVDALEVSAFPLVVEHSTRAEMESIGRVMEQLKQARHTRDERRFGSLTLEMHTQLFRSTGFPRFQKLLGMVVGPVGLRYDKALVYSFDDAWDLYLELTVGRFEALRDRDAELATETVRRHRAELLALNLSRISDPSVARYFRETEP